MCFGPNLMRISAVCWSVLACMPLDLFLDFLCSLLLQGTKICRLRIPRPQCQLMSIWVQPIGGSWLQLWPYRCLYSFSLRWVNLGPRLRKYPFFFLFFQRGCPQSQQEGPCPRSPVLQTRIS